MTNYNGIAMGSSLSPLVVDLFMEDFEHQEVQKAQLKAFFKRYVDDNFLMWSHGMDRLIECVIIFEQFAF